MLGQRLHQGFFRRIIFVLVRLPCNNVEQLKIVKAAE